MEKFEEEMDLYVNHVEINTSLFDFCFDLGVSSPGKKTSLGKIRMSPQHAKEFSKVLAQNVIKYEELFGKITNPTSEDMQKLQDSGLVSVETD